MPPMPFNPLDHPLCLELPRHVNAISWQEHIPFGMALVQMLRPKVLVELGVHTGDSYLAFCQAVAELGKHHDARYGTFSRLVQSTFDEAARHLPDGAVTLLHVDGLHTYEAVAHDWETWKPKLGSGAVVLFH